MQGHVAGVVYTALAHNALILVVCMLFFLFFTCLVLLLASRPTTARAANTTHHPCNLKFSLVFVALWLSLDRMHSSPSPPLCSRSARHVRMCLRRVRENAMLAAIGARSHLLASMTWLLKLRHTAVRSACRRHTTAFVSGLPRTSERGQDFERLTTPSTQTR